MLRVTLCIGNEFEISLLMRCFNRLCLIKEEEPSARQFVRALIGVIDMHVLPDSMLLIARTTWSVPSDEDCQSLLNGADILVIACSFNSCSAIRTVSPVFGIHQPSFYRYFCAEAQEVLLDSTIFGIYNAGEIVLPT